ncbi:MAG: DUF5683 domain-containing protein [Crocinitomicaceae bacterium]
MKKLSVLFFVTILLCEFSFSQDTNEVKKDKWADYEHQPKRAALLSILPGAGQFYNEIGYRKAMDKKNRAWWKIPIIYGGLGACGYFWWHNYSQSQLLKEEILYRRENGAAAVLHSSLAGYSSENTLINGYSYIDPATGDEKIAHGFDTRAKRRDIFLFASIGIYGLNIVEAFVDGHFVSFDVSEDLSLSCVPFMFDRSTPAIHLSLNFN